MNERFDADEWAKAVLKSLSTWPAFRRSRWQRFREWIALAIAPELNDA